MKPIEQIYRAYFTDVYRYCLKLTGNADEAEELTGETFLKAMQRLHGFRGDCELRVWLCQIAKNKYLSERRKQRPEPLSDTLESPGIRRRTLRSEPSRPNARARRCTVSTSRIRRSSCCACTAKCRSKTSESCSGKRRTGHASPSTAQNSASKRNWRNKQ